MPIYARRTTSFQGCIDEDCLKNSIRKVNKFYKSEHIFFFKRENLYTNTNPVMKTIRKIIHCKPNKLTHFHFGEDIAHYPHQNSD